MMKALLTKAAVPTLRPTLRPTIGLTFIIILLALTLSSCSTYRPDQLNNICAIFKGETDWYEAATDANKRWGTPIGVMMAIIKQESSFKHDVRPARPTFLFIPLPRRSSAYGYAQAQDPAWEDYQKATGNWGHDRDDFADAINFVGWYTDVSQKKLGISKWNPYQQYLAYHEGWGGYSRGSFNKKQHLLRVANKVQKQAETYNAQLKTCSSDLDDAISGWF
jgi:hypothetical protein